MAEKRGDKTKHRNVEKRYELDMYKLLGIAVVAIIVAVLVGAFFGGKIGYSGGVDDVTVSAPAYCNVNKLGSNVAIKCNELDITAEDLCDVTSKKIQENIKILIITSDTAE